MEEKSDSRVPPPRVRIFECDRDGIQKLFNRDSSKATKPMDERNFPKSFWIPPTKEHPSCSHSSIENNQDGFCIMHRKSNSSPSCIGTNPAYLSEPIDHNKQKSLDTTQNLARHLRRDLMQGGTDIFLHTNRGAFDYPDALQSNSLSSPICELPLEFQMAINESKQVYFLNHETKQTTWFDPRIPPDEQKWGMTIEELDLIHINYARRQKLNSHSLESHQQLPGSPISVLSPIESVGMSSGGATGEPASCCSKLSGSLSNVTNQLISGGSGNSGRVGGGGSVRPASVPRMQHSGAYSMTHVAPLPRAPPMNLLPPQCSKQLMQRQQRQQQQQQQQQQQHHHHHQQQHIGHAKSSSQPAPMVVSGVSGDADSCMGDSVDRGSSGYALCPSSSLTRLQHPSYGAALFPSSEPLTTGSSGHLAQGMEELSLSRGSGEPSLPHLQQMFCATPLLPLLSPPSMPPPGNAPCPTAGEYGALATQQIPSAQHSHQSSMDSGVGPSVAGGYSIQSANQTPEHTKVTRFDSSMDNYEMGPDFLSYSADWCQSRDYCVPDRIAPHHLGSVSTMAQLARSQQG